MLASTPSWSAASSSARRWERSSSRIRYWNTTSTSASSASAARLGLAVEDRDAHGQHRAGQLGRQHRDEDLAHLAADRDAEVHRDVERDHREVEDVRQHERAEHDEGEGEVVRLEVGDRLERLDPQRRPRAGSPSRRSGSSAACARRAGCAASRRAPRRSRSAPRAPGPHSAIASTSAKNAPVIRCDVCWSASRSLTMASPSRTSTRPIGRQSEASDEATAATSVPRRITASAASSLLERAVIESSDGTPTRAPARSASLVQ